MPLANVRSYPAITLGILLLAGVTGNFLNTPIFFGVDFLFGSIAVLLITSLYGLAWGAAAAVIASGYTYFLWSHPWAIVIFTVEALAVGAVHRRRSTNLVLTDGLYWLALGMPLVWIFYRSVMGASYESVVVVMLKQSVNGILNALIASLLLTHTALPRWAGRTQETAVPLRQILFNALVAAVLVPSLILMVVSGRHEMRSIEDNVRERLTVSAADVTGRLESWRLRHLGAVEALALFSGGAASPSPATLQRSVMAIHEAFPSFHNLYIADADGTTVAFHPSVSATGRSMLGLDFSDRDYYHRVRETLQPAISDVFLGRGGVETPIVTIAVPILRHGRFDGFALGAANLQRVESLLDRLSVAEGTQITVLDEKGRVIASTLEGFEAMEDYLTARGGVFRRVDDQIEQWIPQTSGLPAFAQWERSFYVRRMDAGIAPWTAVVEAPMAPFQRYLQDRYSDSLALTLVLTLLALWLAWLLSRWLARPLSQLAQVTTNLPEQLLHLHAVSWPQSRINEVSLLVTNFQSMLRALQQHFQALEEEVRERRRAEADLAERARLGALGMDISAVLARDADQRTVLQECTEALTRHLGVAFARIWTLNEKEQVLELQASAGQYTHLDGPHSRIRVGEFKIGRIANDRQPHLVNDIAHDPMISDPEWAHREGMTAFAGFPLLVEERVVGVMAMFSRSAIPQATLEELGAVADGVAQFIDRKHTEERLHEYVAELAEAGRQKDQFLAMLAHELRNPLGSASNALYLLERADPESPQAQRARAVLRRQFNHQQRMVDDLLDVSRIHRGKIDLHLTQIELSALLRDTLEDHRAALAEAGLTLEATLPDTPVPVMGDPTRLNQVVSNLLHNAQKYTPSGGRVTVRLQTGRSGTSRAEGEEPEAVEPGWALLSIRDTGIGIPKALLSRIFDPFAQEDRSLDRSRGGLGLGLALVKGLVDLHGGRVEVRSGGRGEGSEFRVFLPLVELVEPAARVERPADRAGGSLRILVVEDNPDAAETLRDLLELSGHEVSVATNGETGLNLASEVRPDTVVCDIGLPGMDGYEVARRLRADPRTAHTRLIAVTGYGRQEDRERSAAAGFDEHLVKPIDPAGLEAVLREAAG